MATKDKLVSLEVLKATTQADVNDLKSAITELDKVDVIVRGEPNFTRGKYVARDGTLADNVAMCATDYISVTSGSFVRFYYGTNSSFIYISEYDTNKEFVTYYGGSPDAESRAITLQSTTKYVRFGFPLGYSAKLIHGTTTQWEASCDGGIEAKTEQNTSDISNLQTAVTSLPNVVNAAVYNGDYQKVTYGMMQGYSTLHNYFNAYRVSMNRHKISPITPTEFNITGTNSLTAIIVVDGLTANEVYRIAFNYTNESGYVQVYDTDDTTMLATSTGASITNQIREFTPPHSSVHIHIYGVNGITKHFAYMGIYAKDDPYGIDANFTNSIYNGSVDRDLTGVKTNGIVKETIASLSNATLTIDTEYNEMGGYEIAFRANVGNMRNITFGKGRGETYGAEITITSTEIRIGDYTFEHGLTITDYIACSVTFLPANARCAVRLSTHGGVFTKSASELAYSARKGKPFITVWGDGSLTNVELSYYSAAWLHKVWMFGDSYFNIGEPARWTSYIPQMVKKRYIMLNGFPGASSADEYPALMAALEKETPDYVIWCLGMNDAYSAWLDNLQKLQTICAKKRIKLIPATIPNVASRNNQDKNDYVRANFDEYIEFALAVNTGDNTTEWYAGMLSDDNVHPSNEGAIALYSAACATIPLLCAEE